MILQLKSMINGDWFYKGHRESCIPRQKKLIPVDPGSSASFMAMNFEFPLLINQP